MDKIRELSPAIDEIQSYLAFTKQRDYSEVIADFDKALTSMKNDHSFEAIYEKYFGPTKLGTHEALSALAARIAHRK